MQRYEKHILVHLISIFLFLMTSCVSNAETTKGEQNKEGNISKTILHVGIKQRASGRVGRYGFKAYIYLSNDPQIIGIDPREELIKKYGKDSLIDYTNSDYVRFGSLGHKGIRLGKIILADRKGDILRGTFWDRFDVTGYLRKFRNRRCYLAAVAKVDRKTYRTVGLRGFLEVSVRGGENIRSKQVYFLSRTGSMDGYLHGTMRDVGLEIAIDIPLIATEEEVRQFLGNYVKRYTQKDIDGFLSLFSPKAVQNQRDGFDEIKRTYSDLFEQSQELRYHLTDKRIEIYQNTVEVRARYELDQRLKTRGKKRVWKGHIRWILAKEDGVLKIHYLDYRHEKSP